jgi:hypothetical protein
MHKILTFKTTASSISRLNANFGSEHVEENKVSKIHDLGFSWQ